MWASFGAQEPRCEILESTLGVHLGLSVLLGVINSYVWNILDSVAHLFMTRAFLYPSGNNNSWKRKKKKVSVFFLYTSAAIFQTFWIWKMSLFFPLLLSCIAINAVLHVTTKRKGTSYFCCLLSCLLCGVLFHVASTLTIFLKLLLKSVFLHWIILDVPLTACSTLTVPWIFRYCHRSNWKTRAEAAFRTLYWLKYII